MRIDMEKTIFFMLLLFIFIVFIPGIFAEVLRDDKIPFFAIEEDFNPENDIASLSASDLKDLGVKLARTPNGPFICSEIEKNKGKVDFTQTDLLVSLAADSGVSILATLWPSMGKGASDGFGKGKGKDMFSPKDKSKKGKDFYGGMPPKDKSYGMPRRDSRLSKDAEFAREVFSNSCHGKTFPYVSDMEGYLEFVREIIERYDGDDNFGSYSISDSLKEKIKRNPIIFWEVGNEPDSFYPPDEMGGSFATIFSEYFTLLKKTYAVIKKVCPQANVVIAAPKTENTQEYYSQMLSLGADKYCDIYNLHDEPSGLKSLIDGKEKPIWVTEAGGRHARGKKSAFGNEWGFNSARMAAVNMAKGTIEIAAQGASTAMVATSPCRDKYYHKGGGQSFFEEYLLYEDGTRTETFSALQNLIKELEYFSGMQELPSDKGLKIFKFNFRNRKPVYVYFLDSPDSVENNWLDLKQFEVRDLFGHKADSIEDKFRLQYDNVYFVKER